MFETPDSITAAMLQAAISAGGAYSRVKVAQLVTVDEMLEALKRAKTFSLYAARSTTSGRQENRTSGVISVPYADINGVRCFYTDEGEGPLTLLLIHGWAADSNDWIWLIPLLRDRYRIVACDLRGHGHSSVPGRLRAENYS